MSYILKEIRIVYMDTSKIDSLINRRSYFICLNPSLLLAQTPLKKAHLVRKGVKLNPFVQNAQLL